MKRDRHLGKGLPTLQMSAEVRLFFGVNADMLLQNGQLRREENTICIMTVKREIFSHSASTNIIIIVIIIIIIITQNATIPTVLASPTTWLCVARHLQGAFSLWCGRFLVITWQTRGLSPCCTFDFLFTQRLAIRLIHNQSFGKLH